MTDTKGYTAAKQAADKLREDQEMSDSVDEAMVSPASTDAWLPADFEEKKESDGGYLKLDSGENRIRIVSSPVVGYQIWYTDENGDRRNQNRRLKEEFDPTVLELVEEQNKGKKDKEKERYFWGLVVYNYKTESVSLWQPTQWKKIISPILALSRSEHWGDPREYDIIITKTGEKLGTDYGIQTVPKSPLSEDALGKVGEASINLEALFSGDNPFEG